MSNDIIISIFLIVGLILLIALGVPIAASLAISATVSYMLMAGVPAGLFLLGELPYNFTTRYSITTLPMFIAMGLFAHQAGITRELFVIASKWLGRVPGSLAVTTIATCAAFAAMCGSTVAATAAVGKVCIPEMQSRNYSHALSTGCVSAAGALAILIPPSTLLIIYGIIVEASIAKLLIAGVIPGIILAILHAIVATVWALKRPEDAPRMIGVVSLKEKIKSLSGVWPLAITVVAVIGGMYAGVMTPTEAGSIGATVAFLLLLLKKGIGRFIVEGLLETVKVTCMVILIIICAMIFGASLTYSGLPQTLVNFIGGLSVSPYLVLVMIIIIYVILGAIMDGLAMVLITAPIVLPIVVAIGFDPIWLGVFLVLMVEIGQVTPPVGVNVFVISSIATDVPITTIFKGAAMFLISDFALVALIIAFPQIVLYLPGRMMG